MLDSITMANDFTIKDLSPEVAWPSKPTQVDSDWLSEIATLEPEPFLLARNSPSNFKTESMPILERDINGWRSGRYIGEIRHKGRTLRIIPRLAPEVIAQWISTIHGVKVLDKTARRTPVTSSIIAQLAAVLWRASLLDAGRHSLPKTRKERTYLGYQIVGKLDAAATARVRASGDWRIQSKQKHRNLQNPVAAVVIGADRVLDRLLTDKQWRGPYIEEQLRTFRRAVGSHPPLPSRQELSQMRYTPITAKWSKAADLSYKIAKHHMFQHDASDTTTSGVLLDVAELWEQFVVTCAGKAGIGTTIHGTTQPGVNRSLLRSSLDPTKHFGRLYPDLLIHPHSTTGPFVVDAKYKQLTDHRRVDRDDLYQLYAYAQEFRSTHSMLAYPRLQGSVPAVSTRGPWIGSGDRYFYFEQVPTTETECIAWFREWSSQIIALRELPHESGAN